MKNNSEKKVTINDVALRSGVSKTTVSRYLNGMYDNISQKTRKRIQDVIEELDYHPNRIAQRLKSRRTMLIGCIIGDISSPFSALLLKGIMDVCEPEGYQVLFAECNNDPERERKAIENLKANSVDGLIVNTSGGNDGTLISTRDMGTPVVLADRGLMKTGVIDTVTIPNRRTAYDCVRLLKDFGYGRVAFFTEGSGLITPRIQRLEGFTAAVRELFGETAPLVCEYDGNSESGCREQLKSFVDGWPGERLAILTVNGQVTRKVMDACRDLGLELGSRLGLVSFDDWLWTKDVESGVTSVVSPTRRIGSEAARLLIRRINEGKSADRTPVHTELPVEMAVRGSTVRH